MTDTPKPAHGPTQEHFVRGLPFKAHKIEGFTPELLEHYYEDTYGGSIRTLNEVETKIAGRRHTEWINVSEATLTVLQYPPKSHCRFCQSMLQAPVTTNTGRAAAVAAATTAQTDASSAIPELRQKEAKSAAALQRLLVARERGQHLQRPGDAGMQPLALTS